MRTEKLLDAGNTLHRTWLEHEQYYIKNISRQLLESPSPDVHVMFKEPEVWITDRRAVKSKAALVISGPELVSILSQRFTLLNQNILEYNIYSTLIESNTFIQEG